MSRLAQEVERQVKELKAKAKAAERDGRRKGPSNAKEKKPVDIDGPDDEHVGGADEVEEVDTELGKALEWPAAGGGVDPGSQSESPAGNQAKEGKKQTTMAKKATKTKAAKAPKAQKAAKAPKAARTPRAPKVISGELKSVESMGGTYLALIFEEGKIVLSPTSNREANRDTAFKALRKLLKG